MKRVSIPLFVTLSILFSTYTSTPMNAAENNNLVLIETSEGPIKIRLYDETPKHRDNFLKLVETHYFDSLLFHRVIKDFMIQGGDPESKGAPAGKQLGSGGPGYQIPAEIVYPTLFHKRGALSAARTSDQVNPLKESSGSQFYIVWGKVYTASELQSMETQKKQAAKQNYFNGLANERRDSIQAMYDRKDQAAIDSLQKELVALTEAEFTNHPEKGGFTQEQKTAYTTIGGTPFLDGEYTVFGEVIEGLDVIEKIQNSKTANGDRPVKDIIMKMSLIKE